jgi:hypothetical protein
MIKPELLDYVVFFETEPEWVHPEGWCYGARFSTQRGGDKVVATIAPDDMEFSFEWWQGGDSRVRLSSVMVNHWQIDSTDGREMLRVGFNDPRIQSCELQLKPHVRIEWHMQWG